MHYTIKFGRCPILNEIKHGLFATEDAEGTEIRVFSREKPQEAQKRNNECGTEKHRMSKGGGRPGACVVSDGGGFWLTNWVGAV